MIATEIVISTLNDLIGVCKDGASRFRTAAQNVRTSILNAQFNSYAQQREMLAAELENATRRLEEDPGEAGPAAAAIPRAWIHSRSDATALGEGALLAECIRGEDATLLRYARALVKTALPPDLRPILERQSRAIQESRRHLDELREGDASEGTLHGAGQKAGVRVPRRRAPGVGASMRRSRTRRRTKRS